MVLGYVMLPGGNVMGDWAELHVAMCFPSQVSGGCEPPPGFLHTPCSPPFAFVWGMERKPFLGPSPQVKLSFPEQKALAGSQVRLKVQASPGSLCAIHTMDQPTSYYGLEAALSSKVVSMERPRCWTGAFP